jgi:hypothetical protein
VILHVFLDGVERLSGYLHEFAVLPHVWSVIALISHKARSGSISKIVSASLHGALWLISNLFTIVWTAARHLR